MTQIDDLLERNRSFARTDAISRQPAIPFVPNRQLYVITCIDPRVEPAGILGLELGDAIVARTVGGRVTPAVLQDIAWISYLHQTKTPDADWFDVVVIHHTDCGSSLFADEELRHGFSAARGYDDAELAALAVTEPAVTVRADVEALRRFEGLAPQAHVTGMSYDVATGLLTPVVGPEGA